MQRFLRDYPGAVKICLDINYRCNAPIAEAAARVIEENTERTQRSFSSAVAS